MHYKILFIALVMLGLSGCSEQGNYDKSDRYPWQITLMADGSSRVFGIHLGTTNAIEARGLLGKEPKLALFENPDGKLSLEMFYKEFTRAGLSGKLILTLGRDQALLQSLKQQSTKQERLESGVIQHYMQPASLAMIDALPVIAMTYMPYANLEEDIVLARFGEPASKIRSHEKAQHWLYPDKGLDLIINEAGKEVLQYVEPARFRALVKPLTL